MTIILNKKQRAKSTACIFWKFQEEMKRNKLRISEEDYYYTYVGSLDSDADAIYQILKKNKLNKKIDKKLKKIKSLKYFKSLKILKD